MSKWRRLPDLNRWSRFCRPVPYHLAKPPYYIYILKWGGWWESNPRMSEPQSDALTTSPQPPKCYKNKKMPWDRVELPTHGASIHCSTNWAIKAKWRSRRESNPRSPAWQAGVITATPRDLTLILNSIQMVTRTGFEPVLPPWKGGVLTTWPTGQ